MRYLVNGVEAELADPAGVSVQRTDDRLVVRSDEGTASALSVRNGDTTVVSFRGRVYTVERVGRARAGKAATGGDARAPMPGQITELFVAVGESVVSGQKLLILEAMKMQQPVLAPFDGTVAQLPVAKGDQVGEGQLLVQVTPVGTTDG